MEEFASSSASADLDALLFAECFLQGYLVEPEHLRRYAVDLRATAFQKIMNRLSPIRQTLVFGVIERSRATRSARWSHRCRQ